MFIVIWLIVEFKILLKIASLKVDIKKPLVPVHSFATKMIANKTMKVTVHIHLENIMP